LYRVPFILIPGLTSREGQQQTTVFSHISPFLFFEASEAEREDIPFTFLNNNGLKNGESFWG
jgi:hypothetical protein